MLQQENEAVEENDPLDERGEKAAKLVEGVQLVGESRGECRVNVMQLFVR